MQVHLVGHHLEITPALDTYVNEKLERLKHRHQHINKINVTLHLEHLQHIAEATVFLNNAEIHAKAEEKDMYAAIDTMIDKLIAQVTKHKEKLTDHHG